MSISVKIEGLKELQMALNTLPLEIQKRPLRSAVSAGAKVIEQEAEKRAPVRTGNLQKAIYRVRSRSESSVGRETYNVAVRKGKATYADSAKNRRLGRAGKTYATQGLAYYWRFLEFGTVNMPARPFLRPAFEARKNDALRAMQEKLADAITKISKKLAKK